MSSKFIWTQDIKTKPQEGGQGTVSKVINSQGIAGAKKSLHLTHLDNQERRDRMAREIRILEMLKVSGIPKIIDHNIQDADKKSTPLFFVCEWIEGITLQNLAGGNPIPLTEALKLTRDLCEILMHCHHTKIIHRDIKPNNIIISNEKLYVVDFGIAYAEDDNSFKTKLTQELGNRFLRLPELMINAGKHDVRADITMAVGILFFLITGKNPVTLVDENGKPPHISQLAALPKDVTEDIRWKRVKSIFDIGFTQPLPGRFASAEHLISALDDAIAYNPANEPILQDHEIEIAKLDELLKTIDYSLAETEEQLTGTLNHFINQLTKFPPASQFNIPPGPQATISQVGSKATQIWSMSRANSSEPYVHIFLECNLHENYISIDLQPAPYENQPAKQIFRVLRSDKSRINEEIEKCLGQALGYAINLLIQKIRLIEEKRKINNP